MAADEIWEDRDIRFDITQQQMKMRSGETLIDNMEFIEDTKGNSGDKGRLMLSNLRIIWHSQTAPRVSLSIGLDCIISVNNRVVDSKLRGRTEALYLLTMTKYNKTRYEFIFTSLLPGSSRLFTSVSSVYKAYSSSRAFRDLQLRRAIISNKQLKLLPEEQIYSTINGVWNLSSDQGNLGTFIVTNIRVVWFSNMNELFNLSLPYIQMATVRVRDSKFGTALVMESSDVSGGYVLGFRIDPPERLKDVHKEISSLHNVHSANPNFGVTFTLEEKPAVLQEDTDSLFNGLNDLENVAEDSQDAVAAYFAEGSERDAREPTYCPELGWAIESLPHGFTLASLWEVLPS